MDFENGKVYPRCKGCELHYDAEWWKTRPVCNVPLDDPEQWYFGDVLSTSTRMSGQSIWAAGKDWQSWSLTRGNSGLLIITFENERASIVTGLEW